MSDETIDEEQTPLDDLDSSHDPAPEYSFDGFTVEFNEKIALTPVVRG